LSEEDKQRQNTVIESQGGQRDELRILISYGNLKAEFSGTPDTVMGSVNQFIAKNIPSINLAQKLLLNYTLSELVGKFQNFVRITPEGPRIMEKDRLSDKELVALQLVAQRMAFESGSATASASPLAVIQETTGLNPKSLSSRLSELSKTGQVMRESNEEGTRFKITTEGIAWLIDALEKKKAA
jgi:hypothetical protein